MAKSFQFFEVKDVSVNNLKGISVKIPLKALTVIVGPSGSGKSSLAFDTIAKIGLKRLQNLLNYASLYLEEENLSARIIGALPPVVALAQGVKDWYPYKTVGELLGLQTLIQERFLREGEYYCSSCGRYSRFTPVNEVVSFFESLPQGTKFYFLLPLPKVSEEGLRYLFEIGYGRYFVAGEEWAVEERGFPKVDPPLLLLDRMVKNEKALGRLYEDLRLSREINGGLFILRLMNGEEYLFNLRPNCAFCGSQLYTFFKRCEVCGGRGYREEVPCQACEGLKLTRSVLDSKLFGKTLKGLLTLSLRESLALIHPGLLERVLKFKIDNLTLSTPVFRLTLGERKVLELLMLFASELNDLLIILDEPTLGLDLERRLLLLDQIKELVSQGNTLLLVEHDPLFIRASDYVIELGFKGKDGGYLLYQGPFYDYIHKAETPTAKILRGEEKLKTRPLASKMEVSLKLEEREFSILTPGINLCLITFSHSEDDKVQTILKLFAKDKAKVRLLEDIPKRNRDDLLVSYLRIWESLREVFLLLPESRSKGLTKRHFSFHAKEGVCSHCSGKGYIFKDLEGKVVPLLCEECFGKRLNHEVLNLSYKGYKVYEILDFALEEMTDTFGRLAKVQEIGMLARASGIAYLKLSQRLKELSGGERLRVELLRLLVKGGLPETLVLFHPTQGLHLLDLERFFEFLRQLTERKISILLFDCHPLAYFFSDKVISLDDSKEPESKHRFLKNYGNYFKITPCQ